MYVTHIYTQSAQQHIWKMWLQKMHNIIKNIDITAYIIVKSSTKDFIKYHIIQVFYT